MSKKLSVETKQLLSRYFDAAMNLYGIITLKALFEIYNSQNEPIDEGSFLEFADNIDLSQKFFDIVAEDEFYVDIEETAPINRDIVAEYLLIDDDYEGYYTIKERQFGKPYYVPNKAQLLKYEDETYHEKTPSFISLRAFFRNQPDLEKDQADEIANEVCLLINPLDGESEHIINMITGMFSFSFTKNTLKEFLELYTDMYNNSRLHSNRGHTPNELREILYR
ncbi:MAG: hypothetical protein IJS17_04240 [Clostridia bacterium]|nr:hypothetical protein [Clostridia bacterium]